MTREREIHEAYKEHLLNEGNPSNGFEYGAKWADNNPVNPWHKVAEELPKLFTYVIVRFSNNTMAVSQRTNHFIGETTMVKVTHWMPIPELPKED